MPDTSTASIPALSPAVTALIEAGAYEDAAELYAAQRHILRHHAAAILTPFVMSMPGFRGGFPRASD